MKMAIEETTPRNDRNANFKYHDSPDYQQQLHQSQNLPSCHTQSLQYLNRWPTAGFKRFILVKYRCLLSDGDDICHGDINAKSAPTMLWQEVICTSLCTQLSSPTIRHGRTIRQA